MVASNNSSENSRLQKVGIVIAVMTLVVAIIEIIIQISNLNKQQSSPQQEMIRNINESFHPNKIPTEWDTISFVKAYRDFQFNVLDLCKSWDMIENSVAYDINDYKKNTCDKRLELYSNREKEMEERMKVIKRCVLIMAIEAESFSTDSNWGIDVEGFFSLKRDKDSRDAVCNSYLERAFHFNKKDRLKKSMKIMDKMKNSEQYKSFDLDFFNYCYNVKINCDKILGNNGFRYSND